MQLAAMYMDWSSFSSSLGRWLCIVKEANKQSEAAEAAAAREGRPATGPCTYQGRGESEERGAGREREERGERGEQRGQKKKRQHHVRAKRVASSIIFQFLAT